MKTKDYNIILINIDGFRKDKIDSCVTLKNFKETSNFFSEMYTCAPYTFASLHAIFSGMYPSTNGVNGYYNIFKFKKNTITTFPELLQKNDYYTCYDIIDDSVVPGQGFSEKNVFDEKTVNFKERHTNIIKELASKKKFFLFLHYTEIHKNLVDAVIQKYRLESDNKQFFDNKKENNDRFNSYLPLCDEYIQTIIDTLEQEKIKDNTIIILFSDHGTSLGEKLGEKFYGVFTYDYTIAVGDTIELLLPGFSTTTTPSSVTASPCRETNWTASTTSSGGDLAISLTAVQADLPANTSCSIQLTNIITPSPRNIR